MTTNIICKRVPEEADTVIQSCISLASPKSFFLFAGAGSGKTGSLVEALRYAREHLGVILSRENRYIGVITYTNAAAAEIARRSDEYPFFEVSTIHSFAWNLIQPFQRDIKSLLINKLESDLAKLEAKSGKNRDRDLTKKQKRLSNVRHVNQFVYSPTKPNIGRDSLNHGDVLSICTSFLQKPLLQEILISRFPILLIDESQDTSEALMNTFLSIQLKHSSRFMLGLFGDMMQRIYLDGKEDLDKAIGEDWAKPEKVINYRSPKRVVELINKICSNSNGRNQSPASSAIEGCVQVFITTANCKDKSAYEENASQIMVNVTGDPQWAGQNKNVKTLTLEHKMAAVRDGFMMLFEALDVSKSLKDRAFQKVTEQDPNPQLKELAFFTNIIVPLYRFHCEQDHFGIAAIVKDSSPLLEKSAFEMSGNDHQQQMNKVRQAMKDLWSLWSEGKEPKVGDIVSEINKSGLFEVPSNLIKGITNISEAGGDVNSSSMSYEDEISDSELDAAEKAKRLAVWNALSNVPFSQIEKYYSYIKGESFFDTHQGVKGLEFPRVMVVLDDEASVWNLFSYEKLFGVKSLSDTDRNNIAEGRDNALSRTNRLFYVICSRAEQSLAIVIYTTQPQQLKKYFLDNGLFDEAEIQM